MTANIRAHPYWLIYKSTSLFEKMGIMHDSQHTNRPQTLFDQNLHWQNHHTESWSPLSPCQKKTAHMSRLKLKVKLLLFFFFLNKYFVITSYISTSKMSSKTCIAVHMQLWFSFNYIIRSCYATFLLVAINIHKAFEPTSEQCNFAVKAIICIDNIKVRFELQRCVWLMKNLQHLSDGNKHKRQKFYT